MIQRCFQAALLLASGLLCLTAAKAARADEPSASADGQATLAAPAKTYVPKMGGIAVRGGPGMHHPILRSLQAGEKVTGSEIENRVWLRIGAGRYVSLRWLLVEEPGKGLVPALRNEESGGASAVAASAVKSSSQQAVEVAAKREQASVQDASLLSTPASSTSTLPADLGAPQRSGMSFTTAVVLSLLGMTLVEAGYYLVRRRRERAVEASKKDIRQDVKKNGPHTKHRAA